MLFNIYTAYLPNMPSSKFTYADGIAILFSHQGKEIIESTLSADLISLQRYFHNWRLKLSTSKTVSSYFHLANRLASTELNIQIHDVKIPFEKHPKYLGVTLDRTLSYKSHIEGLAAKIYARNNLLRRLAGCSWGSNFALLQTSVLALSYSSAEYCCPIWSESRHIQKIDSALNEGMPLISGAIRSTPTEQLPNSVAFFPEHTKTKENTKTV